MLGNPIEYVVVTIDKDWDVAVKRKSSSSSSRNVYEIS